MRYILDTHTMIWFFNGDKQLSPTARKLIEDSQNKKFISIASLWEIAIKINIGKLKFDSGISEIATIIEHNGFEILPIALEHIITYESLEMIHRDPFDLILIAQSVSENMPVITCDKNICKYL